LFDHFDRQEDQFDVKDNQVTSFKDDKSNIHILKNDELLINSKNT
jgi:hypothetical protein